MTNVAAYRESDWKKDDGTTVKVTHVTLEDGREVPGYDLPPGIEANKPLPDGWEIGTSKAGKPYIKVPKAGKGGFGGATAFRNTKEGQAYEQERMDRRTAIMQAVQVNPDAWSVVADDIYAWLRKTAAPGNPVAAGAGATPSSSSAPVPTTSAAHFLGEGGGQPSERSKADWGERPLGKEGSSPVGCAHENTSPLGPTGRAVPAGKVFCLDCRTVVKGG